MFGSIINRALLSGIISPFSPNEIPGLVFGFDANDAPTALDATNKWPRATATVALGSAPNTLAEVGTSGPLVIPWRGGNKAFRGKTGGGFLRTASFSGGPLNAFTVYIVGEWTLGTGNDTLFDGGGATNRVTVRSQSTPSGVNAYAGSTFDGTAGTLKGMSFLLRLQVPGDGTASVRCEVHGGEIITDTLTGIGTGDLNGFTLMARNDGANLWGGLVAFGAVYSGDTTGIDDQLMAWLRARYQLQTMEGILGADWRESFVLGGAPATPTTWTGVKGRALTGSGTNARIAGGEIAGSIGFGANGAGYVSAPSTGGYYSDAAGLGDLATGGTATAWTVAIAYRTDTVADLTPIFGWTQTSNPDTSYLDLLYDSGNLVLRWRSDADDTTDVVLWEHTTREEYVIVSFDGASTLRVWRNGELWHEDTSFTPAGAFANLTRFQLGARWNGSVTVTSRLGIGVRELHVAHAGISLNQAQKINRYFASNLTPFRAFRYSERYQLISVDTPGWGELGEDEGNNIMFPCLLRPQHEGALGTYAMLLAGHEQQQIYLAYSDSLTGGWQIYGDGTDWTYEALLAATGSTPAGPHISSPHVIWDAANSRYIGWAHHHTTNGHNSHVAFSDDLMHWEIQSTPEIADDDDAGHYMRPFQVGGVWYAIGNIGVLFRSTDPDGLVGYVAANNQDTFADGVRIRGLQLLHCGLELTGTTLTVYFTLANDNPGRIWRATCDTSGDWESWALSGAEQFIEPRYEWEGDDQPYLPAPSSAIDDPIRQLRDPMIFTDDDGSKWMVYTTRGEDGIGIALLGSS